ncbi:MAG: Na+/H+ antiporter NhaC family protein [Oscillospiraceae bacterium]|nr:Na+/H+ antiporter NhaC family protein [Oscillospiraceae bacterium]
MKLHIKPAYIIGVLIILTVMSLSLNLLDGYSEKISGLLSKTDLSLLSEQDAQKAIASATGRAIGILSVVPVALTVLLAFITKDVVFSSFTAIISGLTILEGVTGNGRFVGRITDVFISTYRTIIASATDISHSMIILLCLCIGGMIEVIYASGGFMAFGQKMTRNISSPKRAILMANILGVLIFFDDYANALIIGPVMRPLTDKLGVSREKLAFIVGSAAAPVSGIAIISSWLATELSSIESGFSVAGVQESAYTSFVGSLPYCFFCFLSVVFVTISAFLGRDYGPMLKAERRARSKSSPFIDGEAQISGEKDGAATEGGSIWSAVIPVSVLVIYALAGFYTNGMANAAKAGIVSSGGSFSFDMIAVAFSYADTVDVLLQASILAGVASIFMGCVTGKLNMARGIKSWIRGLSGIMLTAVVLVLAWGLSDVVEQMGIAYYLVELVTMNLPYWLLPMLIFVVCCFISFAAGSFGCMIIVMPIAIPMAYSLSASAGIGYRQQFVFACIAAVLSGGIFGDTCSPVTDTTILSSLGAGCDNLSHVKSHLPYAITIVAISSLLGYLPAGIGVSPAVSLAIGLAASVFVIRFAGKKVEPPPEEE